MREDMLDGRLMSEDYQCIELITGSARRRHSTEQKLRIIERVSSRVRRCHQSPGAMA